MQHRYSEIVSWYQNLANEYEDIVKYSENIGYSIENRKMPAVHITSRKESDKKIYFQCQIHARKKIQQLLFNLKVDSVLHVYRGMDIRSCVHVHCKLFM